MSIKNPIRSETLRNKIKESFSSSTYPGDTNLVVPDTDPDSGEIFELLRGKSWTEFLEYLERIDGPDLYWWCWSYNFLTPAAFFYYLPAFLIVCFDLDRVDTVGSYLIYRLSRPDEYEEARYVNEVKDHATAEQIAAITDWVRYFIDEYPSLLETTDLQRWLH